jgi:hypothetical protein
VFGQELAEAGEPATNIHTATIAIAQRVVLDLGTYSASSAWAHAQRRPSIFSLPSLTGPGQGLDVRS